MDLSSMNFDMGGLLASVVWGALGTGYWIYGKKQSSGPALIGGIALVAISIFMASSALWMSLAGFAIVGGVFYWSRRD